MELSRLHSSALRCRQIIAAPPRTFKPLGISSYPSSSRMLPFHVALPLPTHKNNLAYSFNENCSKFSTNGTRLLKAVPVQVRAQQVASKYELSQKNAVLWRFMRPFPVFGTVIQFSSILARRLVENPHVFQWSNWSMFVKILVAFTTLLCTDFFTTGINQIFDIETDRVNKPYLPLTSGELSIESGWILVLSFVAIALLTAGTLNYMPFLAFDFLSLLAGAMYSIPPFRTKASTIGAPITISLGFLYVLVKFAGAGAVLGLPFKMSPPIIFIAIFTTIFAFAMGILKDIPDVEGDKKSNIPTLATIIGVRKTLLIGAGILILNHFGAALISIICPKILKSHIMVPTEILSVLYLIYEAWHMKQANYESKQSVQIYTRICGLYFAHFFLLPFM